MDINVIKKLAARGNQKAIQILKDWKLAIPAVNSGVSDSKSENATYNSNSIMDNIHNCEIRKKNDTDKWVGGFRCDEPLYNRLEQEKQVQAKKGSTIIKTALRDYFLWLDKLNELKLQELNNKSHTVIGGSEFG